MTPDTGAPPPPRDTPPRRSRLTGALLGGALVVAILGGVVGGIIASQPRVAVPAVAAQAASPAPEDGPTASPTPVDAAPPVPTPTPTHTFEPEPEPEPESTPATAGPATPEPTASETPVVAPSQTSRPAVRRPSQVDPGWLTQVSRVTGVPRRALDAYANAALTMEREKAACSLGWNTLAAIGHIESRHGSYGGSKLGPDGVVSPRVIGPALDGKGFAAIRDTDGGALDGDTTWDRAVGPMQFIPSTWRSYGVDGNGDGVKDPHNIDDAAMAAARYLCAHGGMGSAGGWRGAVLGYNRSEDYISQVAHIANDYAQKVAG